MHRLIRAALLFTVAAGAQFPPGPQVLTFFSHVDDSDQPYALYLPKAYSPAKKYPLVVSLHGTGSNHRLNLRQVFGQGSRLGESDLQAARFFPALRDVDFLVASPLARGTMGFQGIAEKDVYDMVNDVRNRFAVDEDRIYLTGLSLGGGGALWLGLTRPDVWAAIAPVCPAPPQGVDVLAGNALNLPVKLFEGEIDPVVPSIEVRRWHQLFLDAGVKSEYVEYPGVRHNAWDYAYRDGAIFDWFAKFRRVRDPARVQFSSDSYEHGSAYWVRFDKLTPGVLASIDARREGSRVLVATRNLDGFTIDKAAAVTVDGAALKGSSFRRTTKGWVAGKVRLGPSEKRPGAEGPILAAVSRKHIYVYGRGLQEEAARAAQWAVPGSPLLLNFRVLADGETKDSDLAAANVVLFGTRETNAVLQKIADKLPMHLNPGAADYGLVYVYPVDGRYVVVSSGLPWWTRADQAKRPGMRSIATPYRMLTSFGDFILFRGGLDNVIAEGRFDNNWRLPEAARKQILASGAVEVRK